MKNSVRTITFRAGLTAPALHLTVDPEGTLIQGGAAIATGGLSILAKGFKDRFFSNKDPCGQAMLDADKRVQELEAKYAPDALARAAK